MPTYVVWLDSFTNEMCYEDVTDEDHNFIDVRGIPQKTIEADSPQEAGFAFYKKYPNVELATEPDPPETLEP